MEDVTCPRCQGRGDIPAPSGKGVTKCFSCGGRGVIDKQDLEWKSKWAMESAEKAPTAQPKKAAGTKRVAKPKAPAKAKTKAVASVAKPAEDLQGKTPLHREASDGYLRGVQELLDAGADVNARDADERTPLHWPAYRGHLEVVKALVEHGSDVNAADKNGRTPLKMAAIGNHADVVAYLTEHGAHL